jgi:hypothetical protein
VVDAPDAEVYFGDNFMRTRTLTHVVFSIRRYRARFCKVGASLNSTWVTTRMLAVLR